jgi:hypothetical protein
MSTFPETLPPGERRALVAFSAVALAFRVASFFHYRFDSDEPQHLHVAWGWTAGLVQYRDLFDNHAPLFHMLSAPLLAALGERADILLWMRAPMLVLFAVVVASTYAIARRLYSSRVALWSALLLALFPPFFFKSLEYRTDNLWNALWCVAFTLIASRARTRARAFVVGLLLGLAFCVSLKTVLLVGALAITAVILRRISLTTALPAVIGCLVPPALLAGWFAAAGAWKDLVYCTITFNTLAERTHWYVTAARIFWPVAIVVIFWQARRRDATLLPAYLAVFIATLTGVWVLVSPRDFLPVMPVAAILLAAAIARRPHALSRFVAICFFFAVAIGVYAHWFRNETDEQITMMRQVLGVSRRGEPLMDYKGETIYRRRPYYYIFENITRSAIRAGRIRDTVFEDVVRARCYVAQADGPFWPPHSRGLMIVNFIDLGRLRAAGQWISTDGTFSVAIPGDYAILGEGGHAAGTLDGVPYSRPRHLDAGPHRFVSTTGERLAFLWAPAFARGYSPFHLRDREF